MKAIQPLFLFAMLLCGCSQNPDTSKSAQLKPIPDPTVREAGRFIGFSKLSDQPKLFTTICLTNRSCSLDFSAPATVVGRVYKSRVGDEGALILFESSELTEIYSSYQQNHTLLKTAKVNFSRVNDLFQHGAATGKELNDASSELLNIQNSLMASEAQLRERGLNPASLSKAARGTVWLICDMPESELDMVKRGQHYKLVFPGFPKEVFSADIDEVADVMNTETRKIRIRLSLHDKLERIRPGMFAQVRFESAHVGLMVPKKAVISANARYYVFVKHSDNTFERREVLLSSEMGDYIELAHGVAPGENVVVANVYLLKGIGMGI